MFRKNLWLLTIAAAMFCLACDLEADNRNYTVTYDANDGIGAPPPPDTVRSGGSINCPGKQTLTRSGYTFAGWKISGGGSGGDEGKTPAQPTNPFVGTWKHSWYNDYSGEWWSGTLVMNIDLSWKYGEHLSTTSMEYYKSGTYTYSGNRASLHGEQDATAELSGSPTLLLNWLWEGDIVSKMTLTKQ